MLMSMQLTEKIEAAAPQPRPGLMDVPPYVPGKSKLADGGPVIKLSSNETPLGPSPRAVEAYCAAAANMERYPDGGATGLRDTLAARHGLDAARIVCGAGSDELFHLLAQAYLGPGDEAIYTAHGFLVYPIVIMASGATPVVTPERDYRADVDAILAAVTPRTKAVFLANPNNPTGTYLTSAEVRRLREGLPGHVLLVLDGAYAEYAPAADFDDGAALVGETANTVMTRTFSKLHGLASARVGWAYCPAEIAAVLNRIRGPFNVSGPGMAAAVASVQDAAHTHAAVAHNAKWRDWLTDELRAAGIPVTPSAANFVLAHFDAAGARTAKAADAWLQERRIIVRKLDAYGLPHALRISIGRDEDNRAVARALQDFMAR